uniref:Peptidase_M3 domain-containing protein n=1 Tax=Macrostomum lignano TaxID=282301 RepID=A0A1I8JJ85_9PLAT
CSAFPSASSCTLYTAAGGSEHAEAGRLRDSPFDPPGWLGGRGRESDFGYKDLNQMVQLFYYENVGAKCKKLIGYEGGAPIRVTLHQEEGLGCPALSCHWLVEFPCFFTGRLCRVTEFSGGRRRRRGWATVSHSSDGFM